MDHKTATAALKTSAVPAPTTKVLSRTELIQAFIDAFVHRQKEPFNTLVRVEHTDIDVVRATRTADTVFEPIEQVLKDHNFQTDGTVGRIMDAVPFTKDEVHYLCCSCGHGQVMTGLRAKGNLTTLATRRLPPQPQTLVSNGGGFVS